MDEVLLPMSVKCNDIVSLTRDCAVICNNYFVKYHIAANDRENCSRAIIIIIVLIQGLTHLMLPLVLRGSNSLQVKRTRSTKRASSHGIYQVLPRRTLPRGIAEPRFIPTSTVSLSFTNVIMQPKLPSR